MGKMSTVESQGLTLIQDWWLTPELYLRRPAAYFPQWRLDRLLQRKAEQGVKVYIVVYKEVHGFALSKARLTKG